jgi:peptide-methionine (S)-S-oxide reductase
MKNYFLILLPSLIALTSLLSCQAQNKRVMQNDEKQVNIEGLDYATFGAGCFWCVEAVFQELKGVEKVISGYMGGNADQANYKAVSYEKTGHAEVTRIYFNSEIISFETLLEVFFTTHDPTTLNRQGADKGEQYRSVIFYHNESQRTLAEKVKTSVAAELWDDPIVTEISEATEFYEAEEYHQNFYSLNPNYGYCVAVINPKLEKFRKKFAEKLKSSH